MRHPPAHKRTTVVVFTRAQVEQRNLTAFLSVLGIARLPEGPDLAALEGQVDFEVLGYEQDPREIYAIPEVRRFFRELDQAWPYWLYFCDLKSNGLRIVMLCCLESLGVVQRDRDNMAGALYEPTELLQWVAQRFSAMNIMCEQARVAESRVIARTDAVFSYFDLPVSPPESCY